MNDYHKMLWRLIETIDLCVESQAIAAIEFDVSTDDELTEEEKGEILQLMKDARYE